MKTRISITLLICLSFLLPTNPANAAVTSTRYIEVSGLGSVQAKPDRVTIQFSATSLKESTNLVNQALAEDYKAVHEILLTYKIKNIDVKTTAVSIGPEYKYLEDGSSTLNGYRGFESYTLNIIDVSAAGDIISNLSEIPSNDISINSTASYVSNLNSYKNKAMERAALDAKSKALVYAKSLHLKLSKVMIVIDTSSSYSPTPVGSMAKSDMNQTSVSLDMGYTLIESSVKIRWAIA